MNYEKIYNRLIERAKNRLIFGYIEMHHVIPRSEGGSNKKTNKVELTPKEHHIAHLCLIRIHRCLKYCFRHMSTRDYVRMKDKEKMKVRRNFKKYEKEWPFEEELQSSINSI